MWGIQCWRKNNDIRHGLCVLSMRLTKDIPNPPVSRKRESKVLKLWWFTYFHNEVTVVTLYCRSSCFLRWNYQGISIFQKLQPLSMWKVMCMMLLQRISLIFSHQIHSKSIKSTKKSTFFFYFFLFFLLQPTAVKVIQGRRLKTHKNKNNRRMSV